MQFTTGFVSLLAAVSTVAAVPWGSSSSSQVATAPVPVTKLVCDGDSFKCTASLDFGDGNWAAQWPTSVFHTSLFGSSKAHMRELSMAPVPVNQLKCDGDTFLCTANLDYGDGKWVAQWPTSVFHNGNAAFGRKSDMNAMAPVPANSLACDGDSFKCSASLDFGDGKWVAQWSSSVFHNSGFLGQN